MTDGYTTYAQYGASMKDSLRENETDTQIERNDGRTFNLLTIRRKEERLTLLVAVS